MAQSKLKIAFIEDDGEYLTAQSEALAPRASKIQVFTCLDQAFESLLEAEEWQEYDVFIIDVMLPLPSSYDLGPSATDINAGLEFHRLLVRRLGREVPTVFLTGAVLNNRGLEKALQAYQRRSPNSRAIVLKTSGLSELLRAIDHVL